MYLVVDVFLQKENIDPRFMYLVVKINLFLKKKTKTKIYVSGD